MSREPIAFEPYLRPQVWGGRDLSERLGKRLPDDRAYGESWEISGHPDHVTRATTSPWSGQPLDELWAAHAAEWTLGQASGTESFPLLLKWLDCHDLLSVQVHPDDRLAAKLRGERYGKTEAWVVTAVSPTGRIFAGLRPGISQSDLERHLAAGTVADCLHSFTPRPGDCLFIPAGTVHAVGGGVLMAEVQQSSDATFRLFDWNRPGTDGRPRPLHIDESLQAIRWEAGPVDPVVPRVVREEPSGALRERLVACDQFRIERWTLSTGPLAHPFPSELSLVLALRGEGTYQTADKPPRTIATGQSLLVPAGAERLTWHGQALSLLFATPVFTAPSSRQPLL